jgi:SAM-dependent methyltransferase
LFDGNYFDSYAKGIGDWDRGYRERLYYYRSLRTALLRLKPEPKQVAEIGCGLGMFSYALLSAMPHLVLRASDISAYATAIAREKLAPFQNARVEQEDAESGLLAPSSCDIVVSLDVVEHLSHPERLIENALNALRSGGIFLFTTPNATSLGARLKKRKVATRSLTADDSRWTWFADRDPTHVSVRSPEEWRELCRASGFELIKDGSDGCWDTPYVRGVPVIVQKLLCNGSHRILMRMSPRLPWFLGENYVGFWRKP